MENSVDKFEEGMRNFGSKLKDHILEIGALIIIATCTFDVTKGNSGGLVWLPFAAISIMEGGVLWWRIKNDEAKNDPQKYISIIMVGVTWLVVALTAIADATWRAYNHKVLGITSLPTWTEVIALYSVIGMAALHIIVGYIHRYVDPDIELERDRKRGERELRHAQRKNEIEIERMKAEAMLEIETKKTQSRVSYWKRAVKKLAERQGFAEYREEFRSRFGMYPEEYDQELAEHISLEEPKTKEVAKLLESTNKNGNGGDKGSGEKESIAKEILSGSGDESGPNFTMR